MSAQRFIPYCRNNYSGMVYQQLITARKFFNIQRDNFYFAVPPASVLAGGTAADAHIIPCFIYINYLNLKVKYAIFEIMAK